MKTIIAVVVIVIVMGLLVKYKENTTSTYEYVKEQTTEVVQEAWMTDEDAIKAAQAVVRKKELEAESAQLAEDIEALQANILELQEKKKAVDKESGAY